MEIGRVFKIDIGRIKIVIQETLDVSKHDIN